MGQRSARVFEALWHLSMLINITQLGVRGDRKFRIRHGVTYEHDALLIEINEGDGVARLDIIGRAVVLAFRLSGVLAAFPHVVTQEEVVSAYKAHGRTTIGFRRWRPTKDDRLRHFKAEKWGTRFLMMSHDRRPSIRTMNTADTVRAGKRAIAYAQVESRGDESKVEFALKFMEKFGSGPEWCRETLKSYLEFVRNDLLGTLKKAVRMLESQPSNRARRRK